MYTSHRTAALAVAARSAGIAIACVLLAAAASPAASQQTSRVSPIIDETRSPTTSPQGAAENDQLGLYAYTLRHQSASEAIGLVRALLSPRGTVELQAARNTLQVRDTVGALSRILPELRSFDRPGLEIQVSIVRASADDGLSRFRPRVGSPLPPALERDLRKLTNFTRFDIVAEASLASREGEVVTYELGERYSVVFQLGRVVEPSELASSKRKLVQLHGFRVLSGDRAQGSRSRVLLHTSFPLILERTKALGLASSQSSNSALMVLLHCRQTARGEAAAEGGG